MCFNISWTKIGNMNNLGYKCKYCPGYFSIMICLNHYPIKSPYLLFWQYTITLIKSKITIMVTLNPFVSKSTWRLTITYPRIVLVRVYLNKNGLATETIHLRKMYSVAIKSVMEEYAFSDYFVHGIGNQNEAIELILFSHNIVN